MTVFLTGATGYIGSAVAEALHRGGDAVLGLARTDVSADRLAGRGYAVHCGDLADPDSLAAGARRADAVIHCAASSTNRASRDRDAVTAMLEALRGTGHPFLYTSGLWVLGETGDRVADETAPLDPADFVAHVPCVEKKVLGADGVRGVVLRPANVYGRGGGLLAQMVREASERGTARYVAPGDQRWPFVHVDDLANLYVRALDAPAGTLLHASAGDAVPARAVAEAASRAAGRAGATEPWPPEEAREELGLVADALMLDQQASSKRARKLLGWRPQQLPVLDALQDGLGTEH